MASMEIEVAQSQVQSYMNQLQKQEPLSEFVQNEEQYKLAKLVEDGRMIQRLTNPKETVLDLVTMWRASIGMPKADVSDELVIVTNFIMMNYAHMTVEEIQNAINMSLMKKLKDCEFFGQFSPMYVASVLEAYLYYRKMVLAEAIKRRSDWNIQKATEASKPTPEQRAQSTKNFLTLLYEEYKEKGIVSDPFCSSYKYLRRINALKVYQKDLDAAYEHAKKQNNILKQDNEFSGMNFEITEKRFAMEYLVGVYFSRTPLADILNLVKTEHFVDEQKEFK